MTFNKSGYHHMWNSTIIKLSRNTPGFVTKTSHPACRMNIIEVSHPLTSQPTFSFSLLLKSGVPAPDFFVFVPAYQLD